MKEIGPIPRKLRFFWTGHPMRYPIENTHFVTGERKFYVALPLTSEKH